jgi:ribosomal protein L4
MVVADALRSGQVTVVSEFPTEAKTKVFASMLKAVEPKAKRCLVLLTESERNLRKGLSNLPRVGVMGIRQLNTYDGLSFPRWIVSSSGLTELLKAIR